MISSTQADMNNSGQDITLINIQDKVTSGSAHAHIYSLICASISEILHFHMLWPYDSPI